MSEFDDTDTDRLDLLIGRVDDLAAAVDRLAAATRMRFLSIGAVAVLVLFLLAGNADFALTLGQRINSAGARACVSYGADEQVYTLLLDRSSRLDPDFVALVRQSRDAKRVLRQELHCPPYPAPPAVPAAPGEQPR